MQIDKLRLIVPWIALLGSVGVIFIQRCTIGSLESQLETSGVRIKRSVEDNSVYVPVFAQISKKAWKRMCKHHYKKHISTFQEKFENPKTTPEPETQKTRKIHRKRCSAEVQFAPPNLIGARPNRVGGAMRDGDAWYITEFHLGYTVLEFTNSQTLNQSYPRSIRTLPYAFYGTDSTVNNGTMYFNHQDTLVSYNLRKGTTVELALNLRQESIYRFSNSQLDVQADEHGMWVIYRTKESGEVTVNRLLPESMKVLSTWSVRDLSINTWCNSFIRCGILYSVKCGQTTVYVQAVYDFYQNMHISGKETVWEGISSPTSVQYDPRSKSIALFSNGSVYAIDIY